MTSAMLSCYLAMDRRHALSAGSALDGPCRGAVLFTDISGFTSLSRRLESELGGLEGAETLTRWLNRAYDALIGHVHEQAGSVVGFSGDAVTCWFDGDDGRRALRAALDMQVMARELAATGDQAAALFEVKAAVVAGRARRFAVGNPKIRLLDLLAGECLERVAVAEKLAAKGEVVVDLEGLGALRDALTIDGWREALDGRSLAVVTALGLPRDGSLAWRAPAVPLLNSELRGWLHQPVYQRLLAGGDGYLAELRGCVALFVSFSGFDYDDDDAIATKLDGFVSWIQGVLGRFGAFLLQLTHGDKGSYLYAAFGALEAHLDDSTRALEAALELMAEAAQHGACEGLRIGIAKGPMRVGDYGGTQRRTYGALGDAANMAARLMTRAAPGEAFVTAEITSAAATFHSFEPVGELSVKGREIPLEVSRLIGRREHRDFVSGLVSSSELSLGPRSLGRDRLITNIVDWLETVSTARNPSVVVEGTTGIGKSLLARDVSRLSAANGLRVFIGRGSAVDRELPYAAVRPVFNKLLDLEGAHDLDVEARQRRVLEGLAPDQRAKAPLLGAVLGLPWEDTELTGCMLAEARAHTTIELLSELLAAATDATPLLLILEDAHWIDSMSWPLLRVVSRELQRVALLLTLRPQGDVSLIGVQDLRALESCLDVELDALDGEAAKALLARCFGAHDVEARVVEYALERAEGHPLFTEQIAGALTDEEVVKVSNGVATLADDRLLESVGVPGTVREVITSRLDRLTAEQLMTLKLASVVAEGLTADLLAAVHPTQEARQLISGHLEEICRLGLLRVNDAGVYEFAHAMTRDAVYALMLSKQRGELHCAVAAALQARKLLGDRVEVSRLARHLSIGAEALDGAGRRGRFIAQEAIQLLEQAGEEAFELYANREAILHFSKALALVEGLALDCSKFQLGCWLRRIGEAKYYQGQNAEGERDLKRALEHLGCFVPSSQLRMGVNLFGQLGLHLWRQMKPLRTRADGSEEACLAEASRCYRLLSEITILEGRALPSFFYALCQFNTAEGLGEVSELMEASGFLAILTGVFGGGVAERYCDRTRALQARLGECQETANVDLLLGMHYFNRGDLKLSLEHLESAAHASERTGYRRRWEESIGLRSIAQNLQCRHAAAREVFRRVYRSGLNRGDVQSQAWGLSGLLERRLRVGELDDEGYLRLVDRALRLLDREVNPSDEIRLHGNLAAAAFECSEYGLAWRHCEAGYAVLRVSRATVAFPFEGWAALIMTVLRLWERQREEPAEAAVGELHLRSLAQLGLRKLREMSMMFPIARPRVVHCRGVYDYLCGRSSRARRLWSRGVADASAMDLDYDEALLRLELGRRGVLSPAASRSELEHARRLFSEHQVVSKAALCERTLGTLEA